ncbi:DUF4880 domain-containing protein [Exilibacterium tricleocarpae]|uniref:DUF4880 domain-containing protein n=1 Tax=Exilibacterium tricleocarpae TaxID=2591008 RepID=A0A545U3K3_9GAMM|nr:FecR domain-containing protein [Exilibacterium tricleocarpae]TQV84004.1 DUF4880 domain-containing protein [Exilibacterium tricleocarpae]
MKPPTPDAAARRTATEWLVRLQSPQLTPAQEQAFFAWLNHKPEHQQAYIEAEQHWQALGVVEGLPHTGANDAPASQYNTTRKDGGSSNSKIIRARGRWYRRPQALAATCAGLAVLLLLQLWPATKTTHYQTRTGERQQVKLADGSDIVINTNSRLQVELKTQHRLVQLENGEAFFNITPDPQRPFVVATPTGSVRVLGTSFNVRASARETVVTVAHGRVGVAGHMPVDALVAADFNAETQLLKNQQITLAADRTDSQPRRVDAQAVTTWRQGRQVYNGERFIEVVADLSRYFPGDIKLGDRSLENIEIVAVIDLQNKASAIAALESAFSVVAVEESAGLVVLYPSGQLHE